MLLWFHSLEIHDLAILVYYKILYSGCYNNLIMQIWLVT